MVKNLERQNVLVEDEYAQKEKAPGPRVVGRYGTFHRGQYPKFGGGLGVDDSGHKQVEFVGDFGSQKLVGPRRGRDIGKFKGSKSSRKFANISNEVKLDFLDFRIKGRKKRGGGGDLQCYAAVDLA